MIKFPGYNKLKKTEMSNLTKNKAKTTCDSPKYQTNPEHHNLLQDSYATGQNGRFRQPEIT